MRRLVWILLIVGGAAFSLQAQDAVPALEEVASLEITGVAATFTGDGSLLMVAEADQPRVRLFDVTDSAAPVDVGAVDLDTPASGVAATGNFALVALTTGSAPEQMWVIAPDEYSPSGYGVVNFLDIPANPRVISVSPNNEWALVAGEAGYITLGLYGADNIGTSSVFPTPNAPLTAAALTNDFALLAFADQAQLETLDLSTSIEALGAAALATLDAPATALAITPDGTFGAVAQQNNIVSFFRPSDLSTLIEGFGVEGGTVSQMCFLHDGGYLALVTEASSELIVVDVNEPNNQARLPLDSTAESLTCSSNLLALSEGGSIRLFRVG